MPRGNTQPAEQTELLESAHVKFNGMSASALDAPAELGDTQTFVVTARCTGTGNQLRKDGEVRQIRNMEVLEVVFGEITKAPKDRPLSLLDDGED